METLTSVIEGILQKVEKLQLEHNANFQVNLEAAAILQSEMLRQVAIARWILLNEFRRSKFPNAQEILRNFPKNEFSFCLAACEIMAVEVTSEKYTRKLQECPLSASVSTLKNVDSLPNYLKLPQWLVREKILDYLTNPLDQLNMAIASPIDAKFMGWTPLHQKLQIIFGILMQKGYLNLTDTWNLCRTHEDFHLSLPPIFESIRGKSPAFESEYQCQLYFFRMAEANPLPLSDELPIPFTVTFAGVIFLCLKPWGNLITCFNWNICYPATMPMSQRLQQVAKVLALLPNLEQLQLEVWNWWVSPQERSTYVHLDDDNEYSLLLQEQNNLKEYAKYLPNLKQLRCLNFNKVENKWFVLMTHVLLYKYGSALKSLKICVQVSIVPLMVEHYQHQRLCEKLTEFKLKIVQNAYDDRAYDQKIMLNFVSQLVGKCPLKILRLNWRVQWIWEQVTVPLLTCLAKHFGETLEELTLTYVENFRPEDEVDLGWMTNLVFRRLRRFTMNAIIESECWPFMLLLFPALEEVTFYVWNRMEEVWNQNKILETELSELSRQFITEGENKTKFMFQGSSEQEKILGSNLWLLLPKLLEVCKVVRKGRKCEICEKVTRREYMEFQQRKMDQV